MTGHLNVVVYSESMKSAQRKFATYTLSFILCVLLACQDQDEITDDPVSYTWITSSLSPDEEITVYKFKRGEEGQLYFSGWTTDKKSIFAELVDGQWEVLARANEQEFGDFTVFQDTVYYSTSLSIIKTKGTYATTLLNTVTHCSLEVFEDKLIIGGMYLTFNGQEYSILSYDASNKFSPIYQGISNLKMKIANQKLFIAGPVGFPVLMYYDSFLEPTTYSKDFLNIDDEESIYGLAENDSHHIDITKFQHQKLEKIGNTLVTNTMLNRLEFNGNSFVISGHDLSDGTSNSFFLTSTNTWKSIDTGFVIYDLIQFDNKILAGSDGKIMELSSP